MPNLDPRQHIKSYIDMRHREIVEQQSHQFAVLQSFVETELTSLLRQIAALSERLDAAVRRSEEAVLKADSVYAHADDWGEGLAKLGHLGHERANEAVARANEAVSDVDNALETLQAVQQQVASLTQKVGARLFRLEERDIAAVPPPVSEPPHATVR